MPKRARDTDPTPGRYVADAADINCLICFEPFWQPTRVEPCGHVACRGCLDRLDKCHMCRAHVVSTSPCGAAASRRSHAARVSCIHCPWTGTRKQQVTQAHVMCPVVCEKLAEEKMLSVMRDVYPKAEFTRRSLLSKISSTPPSRGYDRDSTKNWNGVEEIIGTELFVKEMVSLYCPNIDEAGQQSIKSWTYRSDVIQSLSGPTSCLLWTLFGACGSENTELAIGLALHALAIPPQSPDAFPTDLEWKFMCLLIAASSNHATLRELLRNGFTAPNPLSHSAEGWMRHVIECPIKFGDFECLRLLVENCPFIDFNTTGLGGIMLRFAIEYDRSRWIPKLVHEFGCDVNALSDSSIYNPIYPLFRAVEKNKADCVSELISLGANVNQINRDNGFTALHIAISNSDVECLNLLIVAGADVNAMTRYGITPVSLAASNTSLGPIKALVAAGVDVNVSAPFLLGDDEELPFFGSAMCSAAVTGNLPMVEYLQSLLPKPEEIQVRESLDFFNISAEEFENLKAAGLLEMMSARLYGSADAVAIAVLHEHDDVIHYLEKKGYHVSIKAVHTAILTGSIELLKYTLSPKFTRRPHFKQELDEKWNKYTALQLAASLGDVSMVDMLLEVGATLDITAEEAAIAKGHVDAGYHLHQRRIAAASSGGAAAVPAVGVASSSS